MTRPLVSFLTDFGLRDPSAGICRAVILSIATDAEIVDISHEVRKFAVRDAALLLWCAVPYFPPAVHLAVVDPGVGTERRPVAVRVGRGDHLVGPDNGLLIMATERLGGIVAAVELREPAYRLPVVSSSFHGRDVFAPAAAHLALGVPLDRFGPALDPETLVRLPIPEPIVGPGSLRTQVLYLDTFGNLKFSALAGQLRQALGELRPGDPLELRPAVGGGQPASTARLTWQATFGGALTGDGLLYEDSYGRLCLAVNQGDAAAVFGLGLDRTVEIRRG